MRIVIWALFIFLSVFVGLYPAMYFIFDMSGGLLASKSPELLQSKLWNLAFYSHIVMGGIALLVGWSQFSRRIRNSYLSFHRTLGKIYLIAVVVSGVSGLYIAFNATGGIVAQAGFTGLAVVWLFTSLSAYNLIRNKNVDEHQYWMIRSYAICWAAVTLRIWLPLFQFGLGMEFMFAYKIIAWFCWVPNLVIAELIVRKMKNDVRSVAAKRASVRA